MNKRADTVSIQVGVTKISSHTRGRVFRFCLTLSWSLEWEAQLDRAGHILTGRKFVFGGAVVGWCMLRAQLHRLAGAPAVQLASSTQHQTHIVATVDRRGLHVKHIETRHGLRVGGVLLLE